MFNFASCSNDETCDDFNASESAEVASAGTYSGTWNLTAVDPNNVETKSEAPGTLTFTATDVKNVTSIRAFSETLELDLTCDANITYVKDIHNFYFFNQVATNAIEAQFTGRILGDEKAKQATIAFSKVVSVRVGRKYYDYTYMYSFVGNK
ncbi:MAG: hypothetical protein J5676_12820 [Bacteroidaceae bacterium]|nr:hypothetical protein [Bacteroidaceae bacterium]